MEKQKKDSLWITIQNIMLIGWKNQEQLKKDKLSFPQADLYF